MGLLDFFRRKPRKPVDDDTGIVSRFGEDGLRAFIGDRYGDGVLVVATKGPFAWVECLYAPERHVAWARVWTGTKLVDKHGHKGFLFFVEQGATAGLPLVDLVEAAIEVSEKRVLRTREALDVWASGRHTFPADPVIFERFEPPHSEGNTWVFFGEGDHGMCRIVVDGDTFAVTSEFISSPPMTPMQPGRALIADDGARIVASSSSSSSSPWAEQALAEHASIAAFARLTLELMAVGAPLPLIGRVQEATLDEIKHTEQCLQLAAAAGDVVTIGPLPALAPRPGTRAEIARRTHDEAVVPETAAETLLRAQAASSDDDVTRAILLEQAVDEERHVQLAHDIIAWCNRGEKGG
ncbi:MAG: ferritin-like domain-containing protein [Deltaproteobacteria bacterium]|nr:ferritin-like domain-containing protein [Deltaproteobacteria bacterium]